MTESDSRSTSDHERGVLTIMTMNTNEEEPTWLIINRQAAIIQCAGYEMDNYCTSYSKVSFISSLV